MGMMPSIKHRHVVYQNKEEKICNLRYHVEFWWFVLRKKLFLMVKSVRHYYEVRVENKCIRQYLLCCQKVISSSQNGFPNHIGTPNQPKHVHKYPKQITSCSTKPPISYCIGNWMPHFIKCYLLCKVLGTKRRFLDHKVVPRPQQRPDLAKKRPASDTFEDT